MTYGPAGELYLATDLGLFILQPDAGAWAFADVGDGALHGARRLLLTETNPGDLWVTAADGVFRVKLSE